MKTISDVLEKLKVDDIVIDGIDGYDEYPIDAPYEEQLNFLKKHKFKIVAAPLNIDTMHELVDFLNNLKCKIYCIDNFIDVPIIRIVDTSKHEISKDNPMFMIYEKDGEMNYIIVYTGYLADHVMKDKWFYDLEKHFKF